MKKKIGIGFIGMSIAVIFSCEVNTVSEKPKDAKNPEQQNQMQSQKTSGPDESKSVKDSLLMDNGALIRWFEHGDGEKVEYGEMVMIDYKVVLENGTVVDGNHLINKPSFPFVVGFGMQTEAWDLALQEMRVGDFAEVYFPAQLVRGAKEIKGIIPPNSNNIVTIKVLRKEKPTREVDGNKVWLFEENPNNTDKFDEGKIVDFHCMVSTPSNPFYINTFREGNPFSLRITDYGVVPGLKKALINAKAADRMYIYVPASEGYKDKGFQNLVKPNEDLLYNVLIMSIVDE